MHYEQQFRIPTASVGADARIRITPLLALLQEVASFHAEVLGVGYEALLSRRMAFVLSRIDIQIEGPLPSWGDNVSLRTWSRGTEGLLALRDFTGYRADGSIFLRSSSGWVVVDVDRHRPVRPKDLLDGIPTSDEAALGSNALPRLHWEEGATGGIRRRAWFSDLDPNQHVNNTRYGDWIIDAVAAREGPISGLRSIRINYLGELRLGEEVEIAVIQRDAGTFIVQGISSKRHFVAEIVLA